MHYNIYRDIIASYKQGDTRMNLVAMWNDLVFVATNVAMQAGLIKDKHVRREIASKLYLQWGKNYAKPTFISSGYCKLMMRIDPL